ncbi:hypothetical protein M1O51_04525 [Dehalococcoidia bacterium]|nr:hypothetical protein [Dehalococcoidia bacterium]
MPGLDDEREKSIIFSLLWKPDFAQTNTSSPVFHPISVLTNTDTAEIPWSGIVSNRMREQV